MQNRKKILVVDDDALLLNVTKDILELEDDSFEVITHRQGCDALSRACQVQPDLILLDVNMPSCPGDELALMLRANVSTRNIPVVFYSSNDEDSLRVMARACDARGYICKGDILDLKMKICLYLTE